MEQKYIESPDKKNDETGTSNHKPLERTPTARTPANIAGVSELICSQDDLSTRKFREIQRGKWYF